MSSYKSLCGEVQKPSYHKSLEGEAQELSLSPFQYLRCVHMDSSAVWSVSATKAAETDLELSREIEGLLLAFCTPSWKATWTKATSCSCYMDPTNIALILSRI